jgi:signal peptidase I
MNDSPENAGRPVTDALPSEYVLTPAAERGEAERGSGEGGDTLTAWGLVRELVETVALALILFLVIRQVVQNYRIESHSMEPNFYEGQFVLVNKLAYRLGEPERGDVVVFHNPNNPDEDYIKRIIGLPGDTVTVVGDDIFINGEQLVQDFVHNLNPDYETFGPLVVPDSTIFVMGDNRPNSSDSRRIGPIAEELVVGKAWLRVWPLNTFGTVQHEDLAPAAQ